MNSNSFDVDGDANGVDESLGAVDTDENGSQDDGDVHVPDLNSYPFRRLWNLDYSWLTSVRFLALAEIVVAHIQESLNSLIHFHIVKIVSSKYHCYFDCCWSLRCSCSELVERISIHSSLNKILDFPQYMTEFVDSPVEPHRIHLPMVDDGLFHNSVNKEKVHLLVSKLKSATLL